MARGVRTAGGEGKARKKDFEHLRNREGTKGKKSAEEKENGQLFQQDPLQKRGKGKGKKQRRGQSLVAPEADPWQRGGGEAFFPMKVRKKKRPLKTRRTKLFRRKGKKTETPTLTVAPENTKGVRDRK